MTKTPSRKFLSPTKTLDLIFQKFGEKEEVISQEEDLRVTLSKSSAPPGYYHWKGFNGKTKSVLIGDTAYVLWSGQTLTREGHYSYPSLWFERVNGDTKINWKDSQDKLQFTEYKLKHGIDKNSANSFCCVNLSELEKWWANPINPDPTILARGYPIPEETTSGRILNSHIWNNISDKQKSIFPLERIPKQIEVKIINLKSADSGKKRFGEKSIVVYSPDVINYVIEQIKGN